MTRATLTADQIRRIERGASMPQTQTLLAIECLLHRAKKWPLST